jgi:hypothetical protein
VNGVWTEALDALAAERTAALRKNRDGPMAENGRLLAGKWLG